MNPDFLQKSLSLWLDGGICMVPLAFLCLCIYLMGAQLFFYFRRRQYHKIPEPVWLGWIERPDQATGEVGEIIRYTQDEVASLEEVQSRFSEVTAAKIPPVERRLTVMTVLVAAAPLLGLLGTVLGMLATFRAISVGGGQMAEMIAKGISEALITTEMGLLIAIPGYFLSYSIRRKKDEYAAFLARLESCTVQQFKRRFA